jgi:hypothetical protein
MAGRKGRWKRNFKMFQDIRNDITFLLKKRGEITFGGCGGFPSRDYQQHGRWDVILYK